MALTTSSDGQSQLPEYGRRLLPTVIDEKASRDPQAIWCSLPYDDNDLSKGYEDISYARFANAINRMAWLVHDKLGLSDRFDTIAYMGTPDVRYHIIQMAAVKTGYKVLFSSHMNSLAGHLSLFEKTNVRFMLSASQVKVGDILAARPMKHEVVPELDDILGAVSGKEYPYDKTFSEAKDDPYLILHTSGSTGMPKPIEVTLGAESALDHHRTLPDIDEASGLPIRFFFTSPGRPRRMLIPFLHFHGICSTAAMAGTVFGSLIYVPGFRHRAVTTDDIFPIIRHSSVETALLSPAMVEELATRPDVGEYVSKLEKCLYGGAPITQNAGEVFSQFTYLQSQWGITETTKLIDLETGPEDFAYCGFEVKHSGMDFVPVADGLYEMVVRRNPDSYPNAGIFWRCPDLDTFYPGDLWSPHPDPKKAPYLWKYQGRSDDLICWKDGINFHPIAYEGKHSEHELVRSAVMAGTGHRQAVLLLELRSPEDATNPAIIDKIWEESVVPVNNIAPSNGKVAKTHVILASPDRPFERSVKGTVARKATIRKYEADIEKVYDTYGDKTMTWGQRL